MLLQRTGGIIPKGKGSPCKSLPDEYEIYQDDTEVACEMPKSNETSPQCPDDSEEHLYDLLVSAEVMLPDGDNMKLARLKIETKINMVILLVPTMPN